MKFLSTQRQIGVDDIIIDEIIRLHNSNVDLSYVHMETIYPAFVHGVERKKGSWKAAIELAGLNYKEIARINKLTEEEKLRLFFDYLRMDCKRGAAKKLAKNYSIGRTTAQRNIREMSKKYLEKDINFHIVGLADNIIIDEIIRLHNSNVDLSYVHMETIYPSFLHGVERKKGSWKAAIELAGLNYKEIARINKLPEEEKLRLFFDYLKMSFEQNKTPTKNLAEQYSINPRTIRRHISKMSKKYLGNNNELSTDFKKRVYDYIIEETKKRGGLDRISDLERKVLYRCGYRIIKEGITIFLRRK